MPLEQSLHSIRTILSNLFTGYYNSFSNSLHVQPTPHPCKLHRGEYEGIWTWSYFSTKLTWITLRIFQLLSKSNAYGTWPTLLRIWNVSHNLGDNFLDLQNSNPKHLGVTFKTIFYTTSNFLKLLFWLTRSNTICISWITYIKLSILLELRDEHSWPYKRLTWLILCHYNLVGYKHIV